MKIAVNLLLYCLLINHASGQPSGTGSPLLHMYYAGKYHEVIKLAYNQIEQETAVKETWYLLGKSYEALYNDDSAAICFNNILKTDSTDFNALNSLAGIYTTTRKLKKASEIYKAILNNYPDNLDAMVNLANLYSRTGDDGEAKKLCLALVAKYPENSYFLNMLASSYSALNINDSAIFYFEKSLMQNAEDYVSTIKLSGIYIKERFYQKGLDITNKYLESDSLNISVLKLNAYFCFLLNRFDEAVLRYTKITELKDSSFMTMKYLGLSYIKEEDMYLASIYLNKAYSIDSTDFETCMYLGIATGWTINKAAGIEYLKKAYTLITPYDETIVRIYRELGDLYAAWSKNAEAIEYYMKILDYKTDNRLVLFKLASVYEKTDKQKALNWYNDFLKTRDTDHASVSTNSEGFYVVSYYDIAKQRIKRLKEDLFFEGKVKPE